MCIRDSPTGLHEPDELVDHVLRGDAPAAQQLRALPGVLIDQGEPLQGTAAFVPVEDEVKRPDVVPPLRAVAMTGVRACIQAPFLVLNARHPVAFALPEAVDALGLSLIHI